jgi:hypothetical protein
MGLYGLSPISLESNLRACVRFPEFDVGAGPAGKEMSAFDFIRGLWIGAQLSAPPFVQRVITPHLHEAKEAARLLVKPYLPVHELRGQGQGGPLTVTYIGLEFARPNLEALLYVEKPEQQKGGQVPFWRCGEWVESLSTDMVIVSASNHLIRSLPCRNAIILPEFIHHIVDVRGDWQDVYDRIHKNARAGELRRANKLGYEYVISHNKNDFDEFYTQMYLPTMQARHGEAALPTPPGEAYQYFRRGWLFWIKRDGTYVSGAVCQPQQDVVNARIAGVRNADAQLMREGAAAMVYYMMLQWANQHGYRAVNFLGTDPYLSSGLFQHKRKWGAKLSVPSYLYRQIWIKVQHNTPAVAQFLKDSPFVVMDKSGQLQGLIFTDDPHNVPAQVLRDWENRYITPGLSSLVIRSVSRFIQGPLDDNCADLVIPIP